MSLTRQFICQIICRSWLVMFPLSSKYLFALLLVQGHYLSRVIHLFGLHCGIASGLSVLFILAESRLAALVTSRLMMPIVTHSSIVGMYAPTPWIKVHKCILLQKLLWIGGVMVLQYRQSLMMGIWHSKYFVSGVDKSTTLSVQITSIAAASIVVFELLL